MVFTFVFKHLTVLLLNDNKSQRETKARERASQQVLQVHKTHQLDREHPKVNISRKGSCTKLRRKGKLLKPFERPRFPLPDLPPIARIRHFRQDLSGAESINRFHYCYQDPRGALTISRDKWTEPLRRKEKETVSFLPALVVGLCLFPM